MLESSFSKENPIKPDKELDSNEVSRRLLSLETKLSEEINSLKEYFRTETQKIIRNTVHTILELQKNMEVVSGGLQTESIANSIEMKMLHDDHNPGPDENENEISKIEN